MSTRLKPNVRKGQILDAAVAVAFLYGFNKFKRRDVATYAQVSPGLVTKYFSNMFKLKKAIMREAINRPNLKIVAEGIVTKDKTALRAPKEIKIAALQSVL